MPDHSHLPADVQLLMPQEGMGVEMADRLDVSLDAIGPIGRLSLSAWGDASLSSFTQMPSWLKHREYFPISPELHRTPSSQWRKAPSREGRNVVATLADTQPTGFALSVLRRARARGLLDGFRAPEDASESVDLLCVVPDTARLGALRLHPVGTPAVDVTTQRCLLPRLAELESIGHAIAAFERGTEDLRQLLLLLYSATALGGSRPKCTWVQEDGQLAVARIPSMSDTYPVTRIEVLMTRLAWEVGIDVVNLDLMHPIHSPLGLVTRFDRKRNGEREHFMSARSLLQLEEGEQVDLYELLSAMRTCCNDYKEDARKLWRRLLFGCLINDGGRGLQKTGFLYVVDGRWRLAPASGLRPCLTPKLESQAADLDALVKGSIQFGVSLAEAKELLERQRKVLAKARQWGAQWVIGLGQSDMDWVDSIGLLASAPTHN